MQIISDITHEKYKTVEECLEAEAKFEEAQKAVEEKKKALADARKERSEEIKQIYIDIGNLRNDYDKKVNELRKEFEGKCSEKVKVLNEKIEAFDRDYHGYHITIKSNSFNPFNLIDTMFTSWF